jgi:nucleoside-diphosphate-sugar epimerase
VPRRLGSAKRAEAGLGFRAVVSRADGIRDLVSWWRATRQAAELKEKAS